MRAAAYVMPSFAVLLLTVMAALPLGLDGAARLVLPQLPLLAIAHVTLRESARMPVGIAFAAGLLLDLLTHGPLGYWSFVYVAGHQTAVMLAPAAAEGWLVGWLRAAAVAGGAAALEWVLNSIHMLEPAPIRPRAAAAIAALALYPALALLLQPLWHTRRPVRPLRLERGS